MGTEIQKAETTKKIEIENSDFLVIIVDTNPSQSMARKQGLQYLTKLTDSIIVTGILHLMQHNDNRLAVISCHHNGIEFLYPIAGDELIVRQTDGQYEKHAEVQKSIKLKFLQILKAGPAANPPQETPLAGGLAMALTYIARMQREAKIGANITSRVLIVTGSNESTSQYLTFMNCFFTAQKMGTSIDALVMDKDLCLLQQGCDLTHGTYLNIPQFEGLMQYLLWVFLPEPSMRKRLLLPAPSKVDSRAACFCHRELISIGHICSVCLSIFCRFSPICTTCETNTTKIDVNNLTSYLKKKKKPKLMS